MEIVFGIDDVREGFFLPLLDVYDVVQLSSVRTLRLDCLQSACWERFFKTTFKTVAKNSGVPVWLQYARRQSLQIIRKAVRQVVLQPLCSKPAPITAMHLASSHVTVAIDTMGRATVYDMHAAQSVFLLDISSEEVAKDLMNERSKHHLKNSLKESAKSPFHQFKINEALHVENLPQLTGGSIWGFESETKELKSVIMERTESAGLASRPPVAPVAKLTTEKDGRKRGEKGEGFDDGMNSDSSTQSTQQHSAATRPKLVVQTFT